MEDLTLENIAQLENMIPDDFFTRPKPLAVCDSIPATVQWEGRVLITAEISTEPPFDPNFRGMIAWSFANRKFKSFATHQDFCTYVLSVEPSYRTYCERIQSTQFQKLRLDIDSSDCILTAEDVSATINGVQEVMHEMFGEYPLSEHIYVCDSTRPGKQSLHIIVDRYFVSSNVIAREFARRVRDWLVANGSQNISDCIDMTIYNKVAGLRAAYNHKNNELSVKKIPVGVAAINTLITFVDNCRLIEPRVAVSTVVLRDITYKNAEMYIAKILEMMPGHRFRNIRNGSINFDRCCASICHISGREHAHDNTLHASTFNGKLYARCRHCPGALLICDVVEATIIANTIPKIVTKKKPIEARKEVEERIRSICNREYQPRKLIAKSIKEYCGTMNEHGDYMDDYPDPPTLHVRATMGCGKTEALRRHIAKINPKSVLVISHRVSFTIDICAKLGYTSYQTFEGDICAERTPFVVVQCESLHRITSTRFEMIICDEVESIIAQMFAPTHRRANMCWRIFESLLQFTDRLITMDGNLSQETIDVISMIREDRCEIVHNTWKPQIQRHKITTNKVAAVAVLMKLVGKGDRTVVPTSSIAMAKSLYKMITDKYPDKPVRMYNSETSAEEREATLRDVNKSWRECSVLIYTPTISSGISFTLNHFESFVSFWFDSSCDVFTAMQMSRRARHISSGVYYHCVCETGHKLPDTVDSLKEYVSSSLKHAFEYMEDPDASINADGRLVFEDTPRFRAWLNIHVRRNYSQTHFLESLVRELKLIGGVVEPLITSFENNIGVEKAMREQLCAIGEDIRKEDSEAVAAATELSAAEIEDLSRGIPIKDRAAVQKYYFRKCYDYKGVVTPELVRIYGDNTTKTQYHVRRNLREVVDEVFNNPESAVTILGKRFCNNMIRDFARADGSEVDNLRRLFDFNRDSICVKILNILGLRLGDKKTLTKEELSRLLSPESVGYKWLEANCKLICETFGTKIVRLPSVKDANYLRSILDFINGKLKSRCGVSIKLTSKHSTEYHLEDSFAKMFNESYEIPEPAK